jgi:eukaryotic-like serine/threonine-protein kinase
MPLSAGRRLGPYEIVAPLGAGGMGEVYRARDSRLGRDVAVKVVPADLAADGERLRRFEQEARAAGALNHPNVLAVYDVGTDDGAPYLVTELLDGEPLREHLGAGPLPLRRAVGYAVQIAHGLAAAHEAGIVHRDLKPDNLFVTRDGRVKVLDFGLAKLSSGPALAESETRTAGSPPLTPMTTPGTVMGTAGYMSPEQVRGLTGDHRSDIFSFGTILYEMLSGRRAFKGSSAVETMNAILKEDPPDLAPTNRALPPALDRIVRHCLEKAPEQRFQSARDVAFDLEAVSELSAPVGPPPAVVPRRTRRAALVGLGLAALAVASFWAGSRWHAASDPPTYRRLTFRRGNIRSARFAPDGQTIVYSASLDGGPLETYTTRTDSPESRALGLPKARILGISSSGEMALSLDSTFLFGTLARMPMSGGAPREVLEGVMEADWSPDGKELAVVRNLGSRARLEYPIGKVVYDGPGYVSHPRVSPRGDLVAFIDHPLFGDTAGLVAVVDGQGRKTTLTSSWADVWGLAWAPDARELWFTAGQEQSDRALRAVTLDGAARIAARIPGPLTILDAARDGRLLLLRADYREEIRGLLRGESAERDLSWLDASSGTALSGDGKTLLFREGGQAGGRSYATYIRKTDGSPAVRLGEGASLALSPDGSWALSVTVDPPGLNLLPTGAGETRKLGKPGLAYLAIGAAGFLPDGKRVFFTAHGKESAVRTYAQPMDGGEPQPIGPEGKSAGAPSPDGRYLVAAGNLTSRLFLLPLDGGDLVEIRGSEPGDWPIRWSTDGGFLYVRNRGTELPARLFRIEVASGRRTPWKELAPADAAGVVEIRGICLSDDLQSYVYSFRRMLTDLYLVEGVR